MFRLIAIASIHLRVFLRAWMPSNIILDLIRARCGLKWGVPAMLLAAPYFAVAYWCTTLIETGGPGWLHLIVLVCIWSAFKFLIMGPVSLILLTKTILQERMHARGAPTGHEALPHHEHRSADLRAAQAVR